jgi:hypothetical protein
VRVPKDVRIDEPLVSYRSTWALREATLTHRTELESRITDVLCSGDLRRSTAAALEEIRRARRIHVALSDEEDPVAHVSTVGPAAAAGTGTAPPSAAAGRL